MSKETQNTIVSETMKVLFVGVRGINYAFDRLRARDDDKVKQIAESFKAVGQLAPILVRRSPNGPGYELVAGLHRLFAAKRLKWESIQAVVVAETGEETERLLQAREIEIRENLDRAELSPAEMAANIAALKSVLEEKHKLKRGRSKNDSKPTTTTTTKKRGKNATNTDKVISEQTGLSPTSVERAASRGEKIERVIEAAGTSLDTGVELDALAQLPPEEQNELIDKAKTGEKVSARKQTKKTGAKKPGESKAAKQKHQDMLHATDEFCSWLEDSMPDEIPTIVTWLSLMDVKAAIARLREFKAAKKAAE